MALVYGPFQANKIQFGREATPGTGVAASVIWQGEFASLQDERTRNIVNEQVGLLVKTERSYDSRLLARCSMGATPMTFEQLPHIWEAGCETVSPTGAGPYEYDYAYPISNTPNSIKTYTVEAYNTIADDDYREMAYGFVEAFTLNMTSEDAWMMSSNWVGRQLSTGTATSLSTLATLEEALGMRTTLYIDPLGSVGSSQKVGVLKAAELSVTTGWAPVWVGDGQLYYSAIKEHPAELTFSLTLELMDDSGSSTVQAERAFYEANTGRAFQLSVAGSDANHSAVFQWGGKYDSIGSYENSDENTVVTLNGHGIYSSADSLFLAATITNNSASL